MIWIYLRSEPGLYTVGFYDPEGKWHPESDFNRTEQAAARCHYLNGGSPPLTPTEKRHGCDLAEQHGA